LIRAASAENRCPAAERLTWEIACRRRARPRASAPSPVHTRRFCAAASVAMVCGRAAIGKSGWSRQNGAQISEWLPRSSSYKPGCNSPSTFRSVSHVPAVYVFRTILFSLGRKPTCHEIIERDVYVKTRFLGTGIVGEGDHAQALQLVCMIPIFDLQHLIRDATFPRCISCGFAHRRHSSVVVAPCRREVAGTHFTKI